MRLLNSTSNSLFRRGRATILEKESIAQDTEEALRKKELEAEERRKQSHDLVAESIRRELAESAPAILFQ
jgi:microfibrillar-associated protein 1